MSSIVDFVIENYSDLTVADIVLIGLILALLAFAIWRFLRWAYEERLKSKESVIEDFERRLASNREELGDLERRFAQSQETLNRLRAERDATRDELTRQRLALEYNAILFIRALGQVAIAYNFLRISGLLRSQMFKAYAVASDVRIREEAAAITLDLEDFEGRLQPVRSAVNELVESIPGLPRLHERELVLPDAFASFGDGREVEAELNVYERRTQVALNRAASAADGAAKSSLPPET